MLPTLGVGPWDPFAVSLSDCNGVSLRASEGLTLWSFVPEEANVMGVALDGHTLWHALWGVEPETVGGRRLGRGPGGPPLLGDCITEACLVTWQGWLE